MDYYTVKQASDKLGVSTQRVYELIKLGKLQAEKIGAIWVIPIEAVKERNTNKKNM